MSSIINANHVTVGDEFLLPTVINKTRRRTYSDSSVVQSDVDLISRLKDLSSKADNKPKNNNNANNIEAESPQLVKKKKRRKEDERSDYKNRRKKSISKTDHDTIKKFIKKDQRTPCVLLHRIDDKSNKDASSSGVYSKWKFQNSTNDLVSKEKEKITERLPSLEQEGKSLIKVSVNNKNIEKKMKVIKNNPIEKPIRNKLIVKIDKKLTEQILKKFKVKDNEEKNVLSHNNDKFNEKVEGFVEKEKVNNKKCNEGKFTTGVESVTEIDQNSLNINKKENSGEKTSESNKKNGLIKFEKPFKNLIDKKVKKKAIRFLARKTRQNKDFSLVNSSINIINNLDNKKNDNSTVNFNNFIKTSIDNDGKKETSNNFDNNEHDSNNEKLILSRKVNKSTLNLLRSTRKIKRTSDTKTNESFNLNTDKIIDNKIKVKDINNSKSLEKNVNFNTKASHFISESYEHKNKNNLEHSKNLIKNNETCGFKIRIAGKKSTYDSRAQTENLPNKKSDSFFESSHLNELPKIIENAQDFNDLNKDSNDKTKDKNIKDLKLQDHRIKNTKDVYTNNSATIDESSSKLKQFYECNETSNNDRVMTMNEGSKKFNKNDENIENDRSNIETNDFIDSSIAKKVSKLVLKCSKVQKYKENGGFRCKDCKEKFKSSKDLKRHFKLHKNNLIIKNNKNKKLIESNDKPTSLKIKIKKTDDVTHTVEPIFTSEKIENEKSNEQGIKMIVKKENGSNNSLVVKEIKIFPKENKNSQSLITNPSILNQLQSTKESKRKRGRPRKDTLSSTEQPYQRSDECFVASNENNLQDDPLSNGQESGYVSTHMTESLDSDDSSPITVNLKNNRKRQLSISSDNSSSESENNCNKVSSFDSETLKQNESDLNLIKLSNKKLIVRLTKLNIVPNNCTENLVNKSEIKNSSVYSTKAIKNKNKEKDKISKRKSTTLMKKPKVNKRLKSSIGTHDTEHNNNIDNQKTSVSDNNPKSQSSILRKVRIKNRSNKNFSINTSSLVQQKNDTNSETNKSFNELGTKAYSPTTESFIAQKGNEKSQKVDDNEKNISETVANVVTPRRVTVDRKEADETQKAKLQMLMNATTPRDDETEEIQKTVEEYEDKYICPECTKVLDIINRLEPVCGMTEEDESAIKCPLCSNTFQSICYLDHHLTRHFKCQNEKKCRHSRDNTYNIPKPEMTMESEIYVKIQLKCKYCHELFDSVIFLNDHVKIKHKELVNKNSIKLNGSSKNLNYHNCHNQTVDNCDLLNCDLLNSHHNNEKVNVAAYEVFTCTLCKSTFVMKDEVFDHLLKVHEVSCKYPCFSCLTNFHTLKVQESHKCQEVKLSNLDKLISVAIELPFSQNNNSDNNQTNFQLTEEIDEALNISKEASKLEPLSNGLKRKINGMYNNHDIVTPIKKKKHIQSHSSISTKTKTSCPICNRSFVFTGRLTSHMIEFHRVSPKKATELIAISNKFAYTNNNKDESINDITKDEIDYWEKLSDVDQSFVDKEKVKNCNICNSEIINISESTQLKYVPDSPKKLKNLLCKDCNLIKEKVTEAKTLNREHECNRCTKIFQSMQELKEHKKSQHFKGDKPLTCEICKKHFSNKKILERHKTIKHKNIENKEDNDNEKADRRSLRVKAIQNIDQILDTNGIETPTAAVSDDISMKGKRGKKGRDQTIDSSEGIICPICSNNNFSSTVVLKNHLKHEHQRRASICQFCNDLLIDTSEVRHMLDHHIVPSNKSKCQRQLNKLFSNENTMKKDIEELVRILGKERLQALIIYHDFEGKSNNEMMKCPGCSQTFCNSRACRQHYLDYHDKLCLLCDESFIACVNACKHRVEAHNSTASYIWCIQSLVTAIANVLKVQEGTPSSQLLFALNKGIDGEAIFHKNDKLISKDSQALMLLHCAAETTQEEFLEEVLSEDQLPDPGIEIVIGKDESEDDLLTMLNLSPNYQTINHHESRLSIADVSLPPQIDVSFQNNEKKIDEEALLITNDNNCSTTTPFEMTTATASGEVENYIPSGVYKYNDSDELVLIVTEEDAITYKNDILSLANVMSSNCNELEFNEILEMLRAYFQNVYKNNDEVVA